ncbi:MAG TPA: DUF3626 domain-containing protein [Baekduia sp.]|nr:DUF3626 domain-containing protein [Baekduia sp.]
MTPLSHRARWHLLPGAARWLGSATAAVLPPPDIGWQEAVRSFHRAQFAAMAERHGLTLDGYLRSAQATLRAWSTTTTVQIRMASDAVEAFLAEGRYRNQFSTGTSSAALAPGPRMLVERTALGIPTLAAGRHRPVYGYCTGSLEVEPNVVRYGDAVLRLRRAVNARATFTCGDSLDECAMLSGHPPFCPQPLRRPTTLALDGRYDVVGAAPHLWAATSCGYIEAQVHGTVAPADVAEVVFTRGTSPAPAVHRRLRAAGITWRSVDGLAP